MDIDITDLFGTYVLTAALFGSAATQTNIWGTLMASDLIGTAATSTALLGVSAPTTSLRGTGGFE